MKKLILLFLTTIIILIIYRTTYQNNKNILIIGDGIANGIYDKKINYNFVDQLRSQYPDLKIESFLQQNYRLKDLTNDIKNNKILPSDKHLQYMIKKSQKTIVFIGTEEIINELTTETKPSIIINNYLEDMYNLIKEIKKYSQNIIILGLYPLKNFDSNQVNKELEKICSTNKVTYLSIFSIKKSDSNMLNYEEHQEIVNLLTTYLD